MPPNPWLTYRRLREMSYDAAETVLESVYGLPVKLTSINQPALAYWEDCWKDHPDRRYDWDWSEIRSEWVNRPSHFEVAIWYGNTLCGLAIGQVSSAKTTLSIYLLEGSPDGAHPLKSTLRFCAVQAAESYAEILGCGELHLREPLSGAIPLYQAMGFLLARNQANVLVCKKEL